MTPQPLCEEVGFLLAKTEFKIRELFIQHLKPFGIKPKHYGVMICLVKQGDLSQHEIAEWMRIDRTSMVALIDELEKLKLVTRQKGPDDRRTHRIELTAKGKVVHSKALAQSKLIDAEFFANVPIEERKLLRDILKKLY